MCSPGSSSSISVERQQHKEKFKEIGIYPYAPKMEHYWETNEFFQFSEHLLSRVERVNITGGEPFMIPEVLTILDRLLLVKDTVCISFNTNMTILTEKILSRLEQFKNLEISVSLEGVGVMNNYLRYPSKWEEIAENIQTVQQRIPTAHVSVNHTFQHASVYSLPALAEFCYVNKISLHMTLVQGMEWLTFDSVPPDDIKQLILWATKTSLLAQEQKMFIVNILHASKFDFDLYQQHQDYVTVLDSIRGTNFNQVFNPTFEQLQFNF
jgi:sulfatase maturation enzyme AslB (radical SAM superfamily)